MGSGRWDPTDWATHKSSTASRTRAEIFTSSSLDKDLDPSTIKVRESVDSEKNPNSTPIIVGVDVTGSMGSLAETIIKHGLGVIMLEIYDRKPVSDPHVLCMAIGDAYMDRAPLQVTQFEASIVLAEQVKKFWLEGGGGGNRGESYSLAWYFAAFKTKCDAITKRGRKGYLFTIGDEAPLDRITKDQIKRVFGDDAEADMLTNELLSVLQQNWEVFHLIVKPVPSQEVQSTWAGLLGERAIFVSDQEKLAEVIVSTIQVIEGHDAAAVADSWSGDTSLVVRDAIGSLTKAGADAGVRL
jgi:hypothetical protein